MVSSFGELVFDLDPGNSERGSISTYPTSKRALKISARDIRTINHHAPVRRVCVSVGDVCMLDEPWLELLANCVLFLPLSRRNFS